MRTKTIAGNWKMNKDVPQTEELILGLKQSLSFDLKGVKVIICPPFTSLELAHRLIQGSPMELGAQNMYHENEGAFTGEIAPGMLKTVGCTYVILGHSERRQYFQESDAFINKKAKKAIDSGLIPIICFGETLEQREKNITAQVVTAQVRGVLEGIPAAQVENLILAYEPVWAIGTGRNATPQQAEEVHALIRNLLSELYSKLTSEKVIIQYGGSVKPENAPELLWQPNVDGALVGGACLKADSFAGIIKAAAR
ncbi:MAG: triose-phosphate isomerase [Ignavibacteriales bacterium]|nr:triose-phosphate isomerase [Ignavibacteriales bacterium]